MNATDISLLFLGFLVVMVLLEIRKLTRNPTSSGLGEQFQRLSRQVDRLRPVDMHLPGGAEIVEAGRSPESVTEAQAAGALVADLRELREELTAARELLDAATLEPGTGSAAVAAAGAALRRLDARLEKALGTGAPADGVTPGDGS